MKWTQESLAALSRSDLAKLKANAERLGVQDLLELIAAVEGAPKERSGDAVIGYHFVCKGDDEVTELGSGRFKSGVWAVATAQIERSLKVGAYIALHNSKGEPSYRQGMIYTYQVEPRTKGEKQEGIAFFAKSTSDSYEWHGDGAGEKGYRYS